ncbi:MAG TPA: sigma 54-interacting transcriptional regulator [Sphaerochaeta sp.]|nr:sigma 54-interacting transcriptional regulator [Sphaerochaeta sp.]
MIKILVVVPYRELQDAFEEVIKTFEHDGITISTTHIIGSDPQVIEALDGDIIVARGITASAIAKYRPATHVVPIALSSGDLLAALSIAKQENDPCAIGIITNEDLCGDANIASLVGCQVTVVKVNDQKDVRDAVFTLRDQGCTVLVGGLTMTRLCEENNIAYVHVKTGYQAIVRAIEDAVATARSLERAKTRGTLLATLLNNANYALFAINSYGVIIAANRQAEQLFGGSPLEGKSIDMVYQGSKWSQTVLTGSLVEELQRIEGQQILVSQQPIKVDEQTSGVLFTFQNAEAIQKTEHKIRTELYRKGLVARYSFGDIVTQNIHMNQLVEKAKRFSVVNGAVLLLGETGTGKELFAQSLHNHSPRSKESFVAVNCAAFPEQLLESELFGYSEGAFTGASKGGKAGLFELAHKGTLFLDEIGEMPIVLQAKLLRVLQEKEVRKIGADMVIPVDVRIISAANCNIMERVKSGSFRLDLFYRISLLSLQIPSLRERKDDIGILFRYFVEQYCKRHNQNIPTITRVAIEALEQFYWPGNIRELRNAAERLAILHSSSEVGSLEIEQLDIGATSLYGEAMPSPLPAKRRLTTSLSDEDLYREFLKSGMTREEFAQQMGLSRTTLWRKFSPLES